MQQVLCNKDRTANIAKLKQITKRIKSHKKNLVNLLFSLTIDIKCITKSYVRCYQFSFRSYKNRQNVCIKEYLEDVMGSTKSEKKR